MATCTRIRSSSSLASITCFLITLATLSLDQIGANGGGDSPQARTSTKTQTSLKTFKYLESNSGSSSNPKSIKKELKSGKLIQNLKPLEYDLELDFSETGKFQNNINGLAEIYVQFAERKCERKKSGLTKKMKGIADALSCKSVADLEEGSRLITLHAGEGVTVRKVKVEIGASIDVLRRDRGEEIPIESQQLNEHSRVLLLTLVKPFVSGSFGRLTLHFESSQPYDFVKYSHKRTAPNEPPTLPLEAYVNFRFTHASTERAFPCVNSPKFKSKIKLTIVADRKLLAFSNMPPISTHDDPKGRRNLKGDLMRSTEFAPTPPMPIHRLIFSLGPYGSEPSLSAGSSGQLGPRVRLVAPDDLESPSRSQFALEFAQAALDWMTRKLGRKLPIEQLDLVATHASDFNVTASLGCALIDAKQLLLDPMESSPEAKLLVTWNVALVIAQQWFGGLITERRMRDHWILDGLAGQLALEMVRELRPDMGVHHYVRSHLLPRAMYIRAIRFSRDAADLSEEQAKELLKELVHLSYIKSTAIVGMLQNLVGPGKFQSILTTLIERGASDQASGSDNLLVDQKGLVSLLAGPNLPAEELDTFIDAWRSHPSFPALSVQPEQSNPDKAIQLYQIPVHKLNQVEIGLWPNRKGVQIPLQILFNDRLGTRRETAPVQEAFKEVRPGEVPKWNGQLVETPEWFQLRDYESGHWLKLLVDSSTLPFFIVHYSASGNIVHRLKEAVENFAMSPEDRSSLLRDATILLQVKPELQTSVPYEELASWFQKERVIQVIDAQLNLDRAIQRNKDTKTPSSIAVKLFERHGFLAAQPRESDFEQFVRSAALVDLVRSDHKQAIEAALKIFQRDPARLDSALLKSAIYAALARAGSQEQLDFLFERLTRSKWPEEIDRLRSALEEANNAMIRSKVRVWCQERNCEV